MFFFFSVWSEHCLAELTDLTAAGTGITNSSFQMLQSPAINNLVTNMASRSGMGSPGELRNVMEQCTQDPAMQNIFGDLLQHGTAAGQSGPNAGGGIDLSRIVQQMMPVVSSVLGIGGSGPPAGGNSFSIPPPSVQEDRGIEVVNLLDWISSFRAKNGITKGET
jgi:hypothetical protein